MKKFIEWLKRIFGCNKPPIPSPTPIPSPKPSSTPVPENCKFDIDIDNVSTLEKTSTRKKQKTWDGKKRSRKR